MEKIKIFGKGLRLRLEKSGKGFSGKLTCDVKK